MFRQSPIRSLALVPLTAALLSPRANAAEPSCAQALLLFDRSSSMAEPLTSRGVVLPGSKWSVLRDRVRLFLDGYEDHLRFGWGFLPGGSAFGGARVGDTREATLCTSGFVPLAPAASQGKAISDGMQLIEPYGSTPTAATLDALVNAPFFAEPGGRNFVVLIADGLPACDAADQEGEKTVAALQRLKAAGIRTFVVAFDLHTADEAVLNKIAIAGGMPRMSPDPTDKDRFYRVEAIDDLSRALVEITEAMGGTSPDECGAGGAGGADGGAGGSGGAEPDAGPGVVGSPGDDACGCTGAGRVPSKAGWALILGALVFLHGRRRR